MGASLPHDRNAPGRLAEALTRLVVACQRDDLVALEPLAAAQEGQLHHDGHRGHRGAQQLDQLRRGGRRPARRQQVVDDDDALTALERVGVDIELASLGGRGRLEGYGVEALVVYE